MAEPGGSPGEPPYLRIAAELTRRISERELLPGDKVPSTRQVAQEFAVAIATATKALDVLRAEGLVVTRPRSGTVVAPRRGIAKPTASLELTRERVLEEAVAIADTEGLEAVSMRAVAARCGVAPMSLYRFVESREELVTAMCDSAYERLTYEGDAEDGPWRARIEAIAAGLWRVHRAHPWLGQVHPLTRPLPLPNLMRLGDRILGALEPLGLPPVLQFDLHVLLYSHVVGLAANFEAEDEAMSETGISHEEWTDLRYTPAVDANVFERLPHFAKLFGYFGSLQNGYDMDLDHLFRLGLGLLLDGVEALAARHREDGA
ncbi:GntR family transcriptional regulator [Glycomyces paridis]|uniref:GntR family transcriptional regulator n=1 Tax=Glycomyces paridis TaxID=2126555 RepID=A0A4S8P6Y8_9ACTN|nr:GntR family transcriptional regulator [Glycomyces paridis]THV23584.1 GntR family transcriptional regulator [Glycomyces paridis]